MERTIHLGRTLVGLKFFHPNTKITHPKFPFKVGDRVKDVYGEEVVIVKINPKAKHGAGVVKIRHDDGREITWLMIAHGLKPIEDEK